MIEVIFTLDYEIYGNGEGSLRELVHEPARKLKAVFDKFGAKLVLFAEAAELEMISLQKADSAIEDVETQIRELHVQAHEIALHLHPQWVNARYLNGKWDLDYSEYNLCTLSEERISEIVDRSINYLRNVLETSDYIPLSFRAGNWLFQPTMKAARTLAERGVKIDSSVFKGGVQHQHHLDYRRAAGNGYYWRFRSDVNMADNQGKMVEIPIFTQMVPIWKMATAKRIGLQQKGNSSRPTFRNRAYRLLDRARFRSPFEIRFLPHDPKGTDLHDRSNHCRG